MTPRRPLRDLAASVRARLGELARRQGVEFQLLLSEYAIERLLYRLSRSPYADRFVLKGATLFRLWFDERQRATWDLDLLGRGANGVDDVVTMIRALCDVSADDGIVFDATSASGERIGAPDDYDGVRVRLVAMLADARIPVQVDVGFGDAVVPEPSLATLPTLLDHAPPRVLVYPREAVVAEKVEAMVSLGVTTSRMKDFYDVQRIASTTSFDGATLGRALRATFERRGTAFPEGEPAILTPGFLSAPERQTQWRAFVRRGRLQAPEDASELTKELRRFLLPLLDALQQGAPFDATWPLGGPWSPTRGEESL